MATANTTVPLEFESLNPSRNLEFLEASSASELLAQIKQIRREVKVIAIYFYGSKHIAWIQGNFKKKTKE